MSSGIINVEIYHTDSEIQVIAEYSYPAGTYWPIYHDVMNLKDKAVK